MIGILSAGGLKSFKVAAVLNHDRILIVYNSIVDESCMTVYGVGIFYTESKLPIKQTPVFTGGLF